MRHSDKSIPPAITHNDVLAQAILIELRGLRDDLAARLTASVLGVALATAPDGIEARPEPIELREPAPVAPSAIADTPPAKATRKKAGA